MDETVMEEQRFTRKIGRQGGSLSLGIPAELTKSMNLSKGDEVEVMLSKDDEIIVRKKKSALPEGIDDEFLDSLNRMLGKYDNALRNLKNR